MNQYLSSATRRRFIQVIGTLMGLSLAKIAPASTPAAKHNLGVFRGNATQDFWWSVNFPPQFIHPAE